MTLPRLREITMYQKDNPPVHELLAIQLGVTRSGGRKPGELDEQGKSLFDVAPQKLK